MIALILAGGIICLGLALVAIAVVLVGSENDEWH